MKKALIIFLSLALLLALAACGGDSGGQSQTSYEVEAVSSGQAEDSQEAKIYAIGEVAEVNGFSITIDKAVSPDPDMFLNGPNDGFEYIQVYFTFKNISDEVIETPKRQAIYIVYEQGPTGDDSDMTSDKSSVDVLPDKKEGLYEAYTELAPGESTSGWMVYPRKTAQPEVTMHYYSNFVNVPPDIVFGFTAS